MAAPLGGGARTGGGARWRASGWHGSGGGGQRAARLRHTCPSSFPPRHPPRPLRPLRQCPTTNRGVEKKKKKRTQSRPRRATAPTRCPLRPPPHLFKPWHVGDEAGGHAAVWCGCPAGWGGERGDAGGPPAHPPPRPHPHLRACPRSAACARACVRGPLASVLAWHTPVQRCRGKGHRLE